MKRRQGIYKIDDEDYFADESINKSYLWKLHNQTPAHAQFATAKTTSMELGSAVHFAILEPHAAQKKIVQGPETRRGKKWIELQKEAHENEKILLTKDDYNQCMEIRDSVWRNPACSDLLGRKNTMYEHAAFWTFEDLNLKCKVDAVCENTIIDLKTSVDASPRGFAQACAKYGYHMQDAIYRSGWSIASGKEITNFIFIVVEKHQPYATAIYELDAMSKREGLACFHEALETHKECTEQQFFYGYPLEKILLSLPPYAYRHTNPHQIRLVKE